MVLNIINFPGCKHELHNFVMAQWTLLVFCDVYWCNKSKKYFSRYSVVHFVIMLLSVSQADLKQKSKTNVLLHTLSLLTYVAALTAQLDTSDISLVDSSHSFMRCPSLA